MSKSIAYANYLKQYENRKPYQLVRDPKQIGFTIQNSVRMIGSTKIMCCSGQPEGIYQMADGRIVETFYEFGRTSFYFVFENMEHWKNYSEPLPWNVYWEN